MGEIEDKDMKENGAHMVMGRSSYGGGGADMVVGRG